MPAKSRTAGHRIRMEPVERESPVPYYHQIKERVRDNIHAGRWQPNTQIPTEAELCEIFDVSRTVVRQALGELEAEGLLVREKGRGTFVRKPKLSGSLVQRLTGYFEDMHVRGLKLTTKVLSQSIVPASETVGALLEVGAGSRLIRIDRLRAVNDEPIMLVATYLPYDLVPGLEREDLTNNSLYQVLEDKYSLMLHRGRRFLEAVAASPHEAELLQVEPGAPLLYVRSITFLRDGRPLEYYEHKQRGDRSQLEVELIRSKASERLEDVLGHKLALPPANSVIGVAEAETDTDR